MENAPVNIERGLIEWAIDDLRRRLRADGGDCELVGVKDNQVMVRLTGACAGCRLSSVTIRGIQAHLSAKVGASLQVVPLPAA